VRAVIVGCGYVGLELGRLLANAGHDVVGVRRSKQGIARIEDAGFEAVAADATDRESLSAIPDADWVVYAVSAGGRGSAAAEAAYVDGLRTVAEAFGERASPPDRLVYTSSTGVYGDHDGDWVDETTPIAPATERQRVLAEAERIARTATAERGVDGTVVRFGGLYGPDRYRMERYLNGPITEGYLNSVHRADAAGAVAHLLTTDRGRDEVVLAVDDEPVRKPRFAAWLAEQCGVAPPETRTVAERAADEGASRRARADKRCRNDRLHEHGYDLQYPTVYEGYRPAIEAYRAD
jgi:nucleoside-diphosphate-sugar epimerase